jgi:hypothetical protein
MSDEAVRRRTRELMEREGIPSGSDHPDLIALGSPPLGQVRYVFDPTPACRCPRPRLTRPTTVSSWWEGEAKVRPVDYCVSAIVAGLNRAGVATVGSCCGHGDNPGEIILADGRLLTITANPYPAPPDPERTTP